MILFAIMKKRTAIINSIYVGGGNLFTFPEFVCLGIVKNLRTKGERS